MVRTAPAEEDAGVRWHDDVGSLTPDRLSLSTRGDLSPAIAATISAAMAGRVKRRRGLAEAEARLARSVPVETCALCDRTLGARVEWHHRVPKSEGGTEVVPVHPICHRTIHACVSNRDLATVYSDMAALRARDDMVRFVRWVAGKPADFHAPTRGAASGK